VRSARLETPTGRRLWLLSLLALGVVYGDIGTSPLYAVSACFTGDHGGHQLSAAIPANVLGVLSLITWALLITISTEYLVFILRADNRGEGGILALSALVTGGVGPRLRGVLTWVGLVGGAFLYSDGMLTPAISVLSAVEGLQVAAPAMAHYVVPITLVIIVLLFLVQYRGTGGVGMVFGPVMIVYFLVIAVLGVAQIIRAPGILAALSPHHGLCFLLGNGWEGFLVLGGVFLVVTGGEALYADLGHFGRLPIRLAWFGFVLPALLVNYYGQGALLLESPEVTKPFYLLAPAWGQLPLVMLSSMAAVIASQAVISGTFSLTAQAMQLGWCPRMAVQYTSDQAMGQIYLPTVNWLLMLACLGLVLGFRSSAALTSAYGVSISITMVATTALFFFVARDRWRWPLALAIAVTGLFACIDLAFLGANLVKIQHGGWFPLAVTAVLVLLLTTWGAGRRRLGQRTQASALPLDRFIADLEKRPPQRVPGTAVFLSSNPAITPGALLHNLKHNQVLHEQVVILTVRTEPVPVVDDEDRCRIASHAAGIHTVLVRFGFKEDPHLPRALATQNDLVFPPMKTSYFLGRETILVGRAPGMAAWRRRLFAWMSRNSLNAAAFFSLPPNRVVELGVHVEI